MSKQLLVVLTFAIINNCVAQNVGIGTTTPGEKLEVNGNVNVAGFINVKGTIKAAGIDGLPNQILMKNNSGELAWGNMSEFPNFISFKNFGLGQTWTVPTGITKIKFEIWGAGGGGNIYGGGGGGGYHLGIMAVTPGQIVNIDVGNGGTGNSSGDAGNGVNSSVTIGGAIFVALGGTGSTSFGPGVGGDYLHNSTHPHKGLDGSGGTSTAERYEQFSGTGFLRATQYGDGGDAGNTRNTGCKGGFRSIITSSSAVQASFPPSRSSAPGGGGCGFFDGGSGAKGLVIIYY